MSGDAYARLAEPVRKWVHSKGWTDLRDVQKRAIPVILDSEDDLIVAAATAGGKTEAAFLPLLSQIMDEPGDGGFDVLCVSPLRALISDQADRLSDMGRGVPVIPWHGDVSSSIKERARRAPRGVLVITPESLEGMFCNRGSSVPDLFKSTRAVVVDELHSFIGSERGMQLLSLLNRLEDAAGRRIRRIGLSATLGDMDLAKDRLRPGEGESVRLVEEKGGAASLKMKVWAHAAKAGDPEEKAEREVAEILFGRIRGSDNLVFAGSRQNVESYAVHFADLCEELKVPNEFHPHHSSLSREHRASVEGMLRSPNRSASAVCTSTLELGVDIGSVKHVAQIGPPFAVSSMRQRLGRSGRREGESAILLQHVVEPELTASSGAGDMLRLDLLQTVAMIDLMLEKWCEPPAPRSLHLSTLLHQTLSCIAQNSGMKAAALHRLLCRKGPFRRVDADTYAALLRSMANSKLVEQGADGDILLGEEAEREMKSHSFLAVFKTPEEMSVVSGGRKLGTIPVDGAAMFDEGMGIVFGGRRWMIVSVGWESREIHVTPSRGGRPPRFKGTLGNVHDRVVERMFEVLSEESGEGRAYLDEAASGMLDEARGMFRMLGLDRRSVAGFGDGTLIAARAGSVKTRTLFTTLAAHGMEGFCHERAGLMEIDAGEGEARDLLEAIAEGRLGCRIGERARLDSEKFHGLMSRELQMKDAMASILDAESLPALAKSILAGPEAD